MYDLIHPLRFLRKVFEILSMNIANTKLQTPANKHSQKTIAKRITSDIAHKIVDVLRTDFQPNLLF